MKKMFALTILAVGFMLPAASQAQVVVDIGHHHHRHCWNEQDRRGHWHRVCR
jgi:hypothetical protein